MRNEDSMSPAPSTPRMYHAKRHDSRKVEALVGGALSTMWTKGTSDVEKQSKPGGICLLRAYPTAQLEDKQQWMQLLTQSPRLEVNCLMLVSA